MSSKGRNSSRSSRNSSRASLKRNRSVLPNDTCIQDNDLSDENWWTYIPEELWQHKRKQSSVLSDGTHGETLASPFPEWHRYIKGRTLERPNRSYNLSLRVSSPRDKSSIDGSPLSVSKSKRKTSIRDTNRFISAGDGSEYSDNSETISKRTDNLRASTSESKLKNSSSKRDDRSNKLSNSLKDQTSSLAIQISDQRKSNDFSDYEESVSSIPLARKSRIVSHSRNRFLNVNIDDSDGTTDTLTMRKNRDNSVKSNERFRISSYHSSENDSDADQIFERAIRKRNSNRSQNRFIEVEAEKAKDNEESSHTSKSILRKSKERIVVASTSASNEQEIRIPDDDSENGLEEDGNHSLQRSKNASKKLNRFMEVGIEDSDSTTSTMRRSIRIKDKNLLSNMYLEDETEDIDASTTRRSELRKSEGKVSISGNVPISKLEISRIREEISETDNENVTRPRHQQSAQNKRTTDKRNILAENEVDRSVSKTSLRKLEDRKSNSSNLVNNEQNISLIRENSSRNNLEKYTYQSLHKNTENNSQDSQKGFMDVLQGNSSLRNSSPRDKSTIEGGPFSIGKSKRKENIRDMDRFISAGDGSEYSDNSESISKRTDNLRASTSESKLKNSSSKRDDRSNILSNSLKDQTSSLAIQISDQRKSNDFSDYEESVSSIPLARKSRIVSHSRNRFLNVNIDDSDGTTDTLTMRKNRDNSVKSNERFRISSYHSSENDSDADQIFERAIRKRNSNRSQNRFIEVEAEKAKDNEESSHTSKSILRKSKERIVVASTSASNEQEIRIPDDDSENGLEEDVNHSLQRSENASKKLNRFMKVGIEDSASTTSTMQRSIRIKDKNLLPNMYLEDETEDTDARTTRSELQKSEGKVSISGNVPISKLEISRIQEEISETDNENVTRPRRQQSAQNKRTTDKRNRFAENEVERSVSNNTSTSVLRKSEERMVVASTSASNEQEIRIPDDDSENSLEEDTHHSLIDAPQSSKNISDKTDQEKKMDSKLIMQNSKIENTEYLWGRRNNASNSLTKQIISKNYFDDVWTDCDDDDDDDDDDGVRDHRLGSQSSSQVGDVSKSIGKILESSLASITDGGRFNSTDDNGIVNLKKSVKKNMTALNSKTEEKNKKLEKLENIINDNNSAYSSRGVSTNSYSPLQPVEETGLPHQTDGASKEKNVDHHTSEESSQNRFRSVDNSEDSEKTDERLKMHSSHDHSRQKTSKNISDEVERNQTSVGRSVVDDSAEDQSKENSEMRNDGMKLQRNNKTLFHHSPGAVDDDWSESFLKGPKYNLPSSESPIITSIRNVLRQRKLTGTNESMNEKKVKSQVTDQLSSKGIDLHNTQVAASRFETGQETKRNSESMSRNENDEIEEDGELSRVKSKSFKLSEKTLRTNVSATSLTKSPKGSPKRRLKSILNEFDADEIDAQVTEKSSRLNNSTASKSRKPHSLQEPIRATKSSKRQRLISSSSSSSTLSPLPLDGVSGFEDINDDFLDDDPDLKLLLDQYSVSRDHQNKLDSNQSTVKIPAQPTIYNYYLPVIARTAENENKQLKRSNAVKSVKSVRTNKIKEYKTPRLAMPTYWTNKRLYKKVTKAFSKNLEDKYDYVSNREVENYVLKLYNLVKTAIKTKPTKKNPSKGDNEILAVMKHLYDVGLIKCKMDFLRFCDDYLPEEFIMRGSSRPFPNGPHVPTGGKGKFVSAEVLLWDLKL